MEISDSLRTNCRDSNCSSSSSPFHENFGTVDGILNHPSGNVPVYGLFGGGGDVCEDGTIRISKAKQIRESIVRLLRHLTQTSHISSAGRKTNGARRRVVKRRRTPLHSVARVVGRSTGESNAQKDPSRRASDTGDHRGHGRSGDLSYAEVLYFAEDKHVSAATPTSSFFRGANGDRVTNSRWSLT